ncbi:MAG: hypothetical protein WB696_27315 [Chthoniobacterales bacterium]
MSATIDDPVLTLILGALIGSVAPAFPAVWNALINRGLEQEKRLAALKTKIKRLLRPTAANAGPQIIEDLADELNEMAQLTWALKPEKRRKNDREVTSLDLLEAADMLRQSGSAAQNTNDRLELDSCSKSVVETHKIPNGHN